MATSLVHSRNQLRPACVHCFSTARFITVSTANWTDQMDHFWSATSSLVTIYFVSLILIGSYFALNLVLVCQGCSGMLP